MAYKLRLYRSKNDNHMERYYDFQNEGEMIHYACSYWGKLMPNIGVETVQRSAPYFENEVAREVVKLFIPIAMNETEAVEFPLGYYFQYEEDPPKEEWEQTILKGYNT